MSFGVILEAVKDRLIAYGNANLLSGETGTPWVENRTISIEEDEQPPPELSGFKDFFVTVHPGVYHPGALNDSNPGLHEVFGLQVTVAKKIGVRPKSKIYEAGYLEGFCLLNRIRQVILALNWWYGLLAVINAEVSGTNKFTQPFIWKRTESPFRIEDGTWLGATKEETIAANLLLVSTVTFGGPDADGIERIQCISDPPV